MHLLDRTGLASGLYSEMRSAYESRAGRRDAEDSTWMRV
jgi:hypothetical protein